MSIKKIIFPLLMSALILCSCGNNDQPDTSDSTENVSASVENDTMSYKISSKDNYVKKLSSEFKPPRKLLYKTDKNIRTETEEKIGAALPDDYYDFIDKFGYGTFDYYVYVHNFFSEDGADEYFDYAKTCAETMNEEKALRAETFIDTSVYMANGEISETVTENNDNEEAAEDLDPEILDTLEIGCRDKLICYGTGFPYQFLSETGNGTGLVYFGYSDDFNFFWNYKENGYTVIMYYDDYYFEYKMSFSEFLYNYIKGNVFPYPYDEDEIEYEVFEDYEDYEDDD